MTLRAPGDTERLLVDLLEQCDQGKPTLVSKRVADLDEFDRGLIAISAIAQLFVAFERLHPDREYRRLVWREMRAHAEAMGLS